MVFIVSFSEKFLRRVNLRKGVALRCHQPTKPTDNSCVGNVPAIPRQQDVQLVNGGESDGRSLHPLLADSALLPAGLARHGTVFDHERGHRGASEAEFFVGATGISESAERGQGFGVWGQPVNASPIFRYTLSRVPAAPIRITRCFPA